MVSMAVGAPTILLIQAVVKSFTALGAVPWDWGCVVHRNRRFIAFGAVNALILCMDLYRNLWLFSTCSRLSFCYWRRFVRFVRISFVLCRAGIGEDEGGGKLFIRGGGWRRTVVFLAAVVWVSIVASRITSSPSGFTGSRIKTIRSWRIWIARRDSCTVEERLVGALLRLLVISSEKER